MEKASQMCSKCGGLISSNTPVLWGGKICNCKEPIPNTATITTTDSTEIKFIQICTCGQKCPLHNN